MTYRTDKVELGYLPVYRQIADHYEDHSLLPPTLLEIGVGDQGGMEMFRDLGFRAYGVDNAPNRAVGGVLLANQDDPGLRDMVSVQFGIRSWDVIVDDASHLAAETLATLRHMWPAVEDGGFYIIEDWNYLEGPDMWQNGWQSLLGNMISWSHRSTVEYSDVLTGVDMVSIRHGMIILRKDNLADPARQDLNR